MPTDTYNELMKEQKVYVLPDMYPWNASVIDNSQSNPLFKATLLGYTLSVGQNISEAEIKFDKKFGTNIPQHLPVKICIGTTSNVVFRGFVNNNTCTISPDENTVVAKVYDYKWYFAKLTKITGRWWRSYSGFTPSSFSSPNVGGRAKLKFEMFRAYLNTNENCGYLPNKECVFNEAGVPNCCSESPLGNQTLFIEKRAEELNNGKMMIRYSKFKPCYWTYNSILEHIVTFWIKPYCEGTNVVINSRFQLELIGSQLSKEDKIPLGLSLEGKNPLEALDAVVGAIPGKWVWWVSYNGNNIIINIIDSSRINSKKCNDFILGGGKLALIDNSVASKITVSRDLSKFSKFTVVKGGKLRLCTTLKLKQAWGNGEPFTTPEAVKTWVDKIQAKQKNTSSLSTEDIAYRRYFIPFEGKMLKACINEVFQAQSSRFTGELSNLYSVVTDYVKNMFVENVFIKRDFDAPLMPTFENIVVFGYDDVVDKKSPATVPKELGGKDANNVVIYPAKDYTFDPDTGVIEFSKAQYEQPAQRYEDTGMKADYDKSVDNNSTMVTAPYSNTALGEPNSTLADVPLTSRDLFVTLSIVVDLPAIVGDEKEYYNPYLTSSSSFTQHIDLGNIDLNMHVNAFYPVLDESLIVSLNKPSKLTSSISLETSRILARCDNFKNYEMFQNKSDEVLLKRLSNFIDSMNLFDETINVDMGCLNLNYSLGDMITAVVNSELEDDLNSGYYGLLDYVSEVSVKLEGENKGYTTTVTATNIKEFQSSRYDNKSIEEYRKPGNLRRSGKHKLYSGVEMDGDTPKYTLS